MQTPQIQKSLFPDSAASLFRLFSCDNGTAYLDSSLSGPSGYYLVLVPYHTFAKKAPAAMLTARNPVIPFEKCWKTISSLMSSRISHRFQSYPEPLDIFRMITEDSGWAYGAKIRLSYKFLTHHGFFMMSSL